MKRSEGKVKELKEKWRKWRKGDKHWSSLENCEEKTGIDREKQRFWPKLNELFASRSTGKPSSTHGATTSTTVPPDHLPVHCLQLNSTGNNWLCAHYHQSNRSGPLSSGLVGLRDLDKAGSAQGRRKEGAPRTAWKPQPGACRDWLQGQHTPLGCWRCVSSAGL